MYIIFSPYMVNVVSTIYRENKRNQKKIGKKEPCSTQKAFAFVKSGTRRYPSNSDRPVVARRSTRKKKERVVLRHIGLLK